jgi:hypothetical protein
VALETYSRLAHNTEAERRACEIRLRAERKAGKLLAEIEKARAGRHPKNNRSTDTTNYSQPTLRDLNITKDQSSNWQKLAKVPEPDFEAALADPTTKPTTAGIIRASEEPKPNPVSHEAIWLWGRLRDFDRDGLLSADPDNILATMTPAMLDDVHTLAPRVSAWLKKIGRPNNVTLLKNALPAEIEIRRAFDRFWPVYPKRVGKQDAYKAFERAIGKRGVDPEKIIAAAGRYASERANEDPQFTKHPATWLNAGCWDDEPSGATVIDEGGNIVGTAKRPRDYLELAMSMTEGDQQ